MNIYKYTLNNSNKYLTSEELTSVVKENDSIQSYLFDNENHMLFKQHQTYIYESGFFTRKLWPRQLAYYHSLPKDPYTEMVSQMVDEKMWCPVQ